MGTVTKLLILVIIVCSIYLYNYYNINTTMINGSKLIQRNSIVALYAILGGFLAFLMFLILQNILDATDVQDLILIALIILSSIVCGCTGLIVKTIKGLYAIKKDK